MAKCPGVFGSNAQRSYFDYKKKRKGPTSIMTCTNYKTLKSPLAYIRIHCFIILILRKTICGGVLNLYMGRTVILVDGPKVFEQSFIASTCGDPRWRGLKSAKCFRSDVVWKMEWCDLGSQSSPINPYYRWVPAYSIICTKCITSGFKRFESLTVFANQYIWNDIWRFLRKAYDNSLCELVMPSLFEIEGYSPRKDKGFFVTLKLQYRMIFDFLIKKK